MAQRKFFVDLNLNQNELISAVIEKTATKASGAGVKGQIYYNTDTDKILVHNGTAWVNIAPDIEAMTFMGGINVTVAPPASPLNGDTYVVTTGGTPEATWVFDPAGVAIQAGDMIIYNSTGTSWVVVQRNIDAATESAGGFVQLATQAESNTGTDDAKAITPLKLAGTVENFRQSNTLATSVVFESRSITSSGTALAHNLNTKNVLVAVYDAYDSLVDVQVVATDLNNVTLSANATTAANRIVVTGYKAP